MSQEKCKLCNENEDLKNSHIIPSYVFKWLKDTSVTGYIRSGKEPNLRSQDGFKMPMLCEECEQLFSRRERWFKLKAFDPYIKSGDPVPDEEELLYFAVSLLWRAAVVGDWPAQAERDSIKEILENWRSYLLGKTSFLGFYPHVFLTNLPGPDEKKHSKLEAVYITRAADIAIVPWDGLLMVYVKFTRFVFIAPLFGYEPALWQGTLIQGTGGEIVSPQSIRDDRFGSFFVNRPIQIQKLLESEILDRQIQHINKAYDNRKRPPGSTDLDKVIQISESQPFDPTGYALFNLLSSLPDDFEVKEDFSISAPPGYIPIVIKKIEKDGWDGPQMVFQTAISLEKKHRILMIYGIAPDGIGHLFGYSFQGLLDVELGERQLLVNEDTRPLAQRQYMIFQEWVDCALGHLSNRCSFDI